MTTYCFFDMKVTGRIEDIREFMAVGQGDTLSGRSLGEVVDFFPIDSEKRVLSTSLYSQEFSGDCASSAKAAFIDSSTLESGLPFEARNLNLIVEIYTTEPVVGFAEHLIVSFGNLIHEEVVPLESYQWDELRPEEQDKVCYEQGLSLDQVVARMDYKGEVQFGGFEIPEFQDHLALYKDASLEVLAARLCSFVQQNDTYEYMDTLDQLEEPEQTRAIKIQLHDPVSLQGMIEYMSLYIEEWDGEKSVRSEAELLYCALLDIKQGHVLDLPHLSPIEYDVVAAQLALSAAREHEIRAASNERIHRQADDSLQL